MSARHPALSLSHCFELEKQQLAEGGADASSDETRFVNPRGRPDLSSQTLTAIARPASLDVSTVTRCRRAE